MSYIRSTSNPEALYIWGDGKEVTIMKGFDIVGTIPVTVFNGLIRKYHKHFEDCTYEGAEVKEVKSGKNFKIRLSYKGWKCFMWDVTWSYIVLSNIKLISKK